MQGTSEFLAKACSRNIPSVLSKPASTVVCSAHYVEHFVRMAQERLEKSQGEKWRRGGEWGGGEGLRSWSISVPMASALAYHTYGYNNIFILDMVSLPNILV